MKVCTENGQIYERNIQIAAWNATVHTLLLSKQSLTNGTATTVFTGYSPVWLYSSWKKLWKDFTKVWFCIIQDIIQKLLSNLKAKPQSVFQKRFGGWKKHRHKCIISNGDFFKGDNINIDEKRYNSLNKPKLFKLFYQPL